MLALFTLSLSEANNTDKYLRDWDSVEVDLPARLLLSLCTGLC